MSTLNATLLSPREYREQRPSVFHSDDSLRWFIRMNHAELVRRGALLMPTGRKLPDAAAFDQAVRDIGARKAALRTNKAACVAQG